MIADSNTEPHAARALVLGKPRAGATTARTVTMEASMCVRFRPPKMAGRVADRVQVFGGSGYMARTVAERFYRDVRVFRLSRGHHADPPARHRQARHGCAAPIALEARGPG
ncbi:acyl-CoA dehydrogenase family protein [Cupriavidus basilensis]